MAFKFIINVGLGNCAVAISYKGRSLIAGKVYVNYHYLHMAESLVKTRVN